MANIEIDGKMHQVENGKMIIEVTDALGIHIPRFCYHKKLSVAANCRMCLVQVEKSNKPVPACATPITDGMKIFTQSEETLRSQKAIMEFLLINHPLDCPICDQGGECELQDVSLGFGAGESAYHEGKRAVVDQDLGPLIATEMTRCIHCTRCVRFGDEIAGMREMGATGRGENTQIGTYVQHAMKSEVSGNIIDLCPVGALTSRPYRFTARAWEMSQFKGISPHDCLGSHLSIHVRRQEVMRVVPREQESLNEVWLSDRDRFGYLGLTHALRSKFPRIKRAGRWEVVDWKTALQHAIALLQKCLSQHGASQVAAFASSSSSLEELYLLQRWMRAIGVTNLDHRLQQTDFRDQCHLPLMPTSSMVYEELDHKNTILLCGTHLNREVPLAALRVRKAFLSGAKIAAINPIRYPLPFDLSEQWITTLHQMVYSMGKILLALVAKRDELPEEVQQWLQEIKPDAASKRLAEAFKLGNAAIVTGAIAENHPEASRLRTLIHLITLQAPVQHLQLTVGANAAGAWLAGMIPHRAEAGAPLDQADIPTESLFQKPMKGVCLLGVGVQDFANPALIQENLSKAECVIALSAFDSLDLEAYADVILPIGTFTETSGTYLNVDHTWQSVTGCSQLPGEARPAWKVLRVLANLMKCEKFSYDSSEEVREELRALWENHQPIPYKPWLSSDLMQAPGTLTRVGEWPLYGSDALVRHAIPLQQCAAADEVVVRMHPDTLKKLGLCETVRVTQQQHSLVLPVRADETVAPGVVALLTGTSQTAMLGEAFGAIACENV